MHAPALVMGAGSCEGPAGPETAGVGRGKGAAGRGHLMTALEPGSSSSSRLLTTGSKPGTITTDPYDFWFSSSRGTTAALVLALAGPPRGGLEMVLRGGNSGSVR
jgi:hypothetical protein